MYNFKKTIKTLKSKAGSAFVDTMVKVIIGVVIGALVLGGLYVVADNVLSTSKTKVSSLFEYSNDAQNGGSGGGPVAPVEQAGVHYTDGSFESYDQLIEKTKDDGYYKITATTFPGFDSKEKAELVQKIVLPDGVETYSSGTSSLYYSSLDSITMPKSLKTIGANSLGGNKLVHIYYNGTRANWKSVNIDVEQNGEWLPVTYIHYSDDTNTYGAGLYDTYASEGGSFEGQRRDYYSWQDLIDGGYINVEGNKLISFTNPLTYFEHYTSEFAIVLPKNINYIEAGTFANSCSQSDSYSQSAHYGNCINYILIPNANDVEFGEGCFGSNTIFVYKGGSDKIDKSFCGGLNGEDGAAYDWDNAEIVDHKITFN